MHGGSNSKAGPGRGLSALLGVTVADINVATLNEA